MPAPTVSVQVLSRSEDTGETIIRVRPLHGDEVRVSETGVPISVSQTLERSDMETHAPRLWFLAMDSQNPGRLGEPFEWTATVTVKHRLYQDGAERRCELRAIPSGRIRYTTDGSSPDIAGVVYEQPFVVPKGTHVILAIAEADGVRSAVTKFDLPVNGVGGVVVDSRQPATWRHLHQCDDTSRSYALLEAANQRRARLAGVTLTVARETRWVQFTSAEDLPIDATTAIDLANRLKEFIADGNLDLRVEAMLFEIGADLSGLVSDLKLEMAPGELIQ